MNLSSHSNSMQPSDSAMLAGYQILGEISRGGMGVVYRVRHPRLNREMALKLILKPHSDPRLTERFKREAQTLGQLRHPNILSVSDFGYEKGTPYLVMDFIEGEDLESVLKREFRDQGEIELDWLIPKLRDLADALAYCHKAGITHRDLKPENILIEKETGRLVLIDFGLVKQESKSGGDSLAELSLSGEMLGTPEYMSPEQFDPSGEFGKPGPASDVWAFGVLLYYCLSGQKPFQSDTAYECCIAVLGNEPKPFKAVNERCPRLLSDLALDCLNKNSSARPSMSELSDILNRPVQDMSGRPSFKGLKWLVAVIVMAALLALVLVFFLYRDKVAPDIVWDPRPKSYFGEEVVLSGEVTEADCSLQIDGKTVPIKNWRFHVKVPVTLEGNHVRVELMDAAGNLYKDEVYFKRSATVRVSKQPQEDAFSSIAEALKSTPKEVTIEIEPGEYVESIVLKESRTIVASPSSQPVIWRSNKGPCLTVKRGKTRLRGLMLRGANKDSGLVIESGQVTLEKVKVSAQGEFGICVTGDSSTLQANNCLIERCAKFGVFLGKNATASLKDCRITKSGNCNIVCQEGSDVELKDCEVSRAGEKGVSIVAASMTARKCSFTGNKGLGLHVLKGSVVEVNHCRFMNTVSTMGKKTGFRYKGSGLSFSSGGELKVSNCLFAKNDGHGLALGAGAGISTVEKSHANSNKLNGYSVRATSKKAAVFKDCMAEANKVNGYFIVYQSEVKLEHCESNKNGRDGFLVQKGASAILSNCKAFKNRISGIAMSLKGAKVLARNCEAKSNKYGFFVRDDSQLNGVGLVAKDNRVNGLVAQGQCRVELIESTIIGNAAYDLCVVKGSTLIAENSIFEKESPHFLYKDEASKLTIKGD